jgi:hypothetical protein
MSGLKSVMFGDIQYQVSQPVQNDTDGYFYQRARQITRDGSVENEFIFRSSGPGDAAVLIDPDGGKTAAIGYVVTALDFVNMTYRTITIGSNPLGAGQLETAVTRLVKDLSNGVPYPDGLKVGFQSWSGTDAPWDPSTLKSDPTPKWAPGPMERLFSSTESSSQANQYAALEDAAVADRVTNADATRIVNVKLDDGSTDSFHQRRDGVVDKVTTSDSLERETSEDNWESNGALLKKYYDTQNYHPYTELDVSEDATGKITGAQIKVDGQPNPNTPADFSSVGQVLGSALGRALAPNNQFVQLAAGTVVGAIGQKLAQAFAASLATNGADFNPASVFAGFGVSLAGAGASSVASFLVAELGTALNFPGFGGKLFDTGVGGFAGSVASQIATKMATPGVTFETAIAGLDFGSAAVSAGYGVSALFGTLLGQELAPAQTHEGAVGGQLLGAVGSAIGISAAISLGLSSVLNFIIPGFGSLIGTILGTLIFNHFGTSPSPGAVDLLDQAGNLYGYREYQASDHGTYDFPDKMAPAADAIINAYLHAVNGVALDHFKQVTLGYIVNPDLLFLSGTPGNANHSFTDANDAVHAAALDVLQHTEVIGGDLLLKRAHQNSVSKCTQNRRALSRVSSRGACGRRHLSRAIVSIACVQLKCA